MRKGSKLLLIAAVAALAHSSPSLAKKADFISCDGLKAPTKGGNGMRPPPDNPHGLGILRYNVAACDTALADPLLLPSHAARRTNLLRARAIGHLFAGNADQALADIDAAQEVAKDLFSDPLFARSMGVSLDLVRAAAWHRKGDLARARQLALSASDARPYSLAVQTIVANFLDLTASLAEQSSPYERLLPLEPEILSRQHVWLVENRQYNEALLLHPRLNHEFPQLPPQQPNAVHFGGLPKHASTLFESIINSLFTAYAHAATGDPEKALTLLTDTRTKVEMALAAQTAIGPTSLTKTINEVLDQWSFMISGRADIAQGKAHEVLKSLVGRELPTSLVVVEFYTALKQALPNDQKSLAPAPEAFAAKIAAHKQNGSLEIARFARTLPYAEFSNRSTDYKKSSKSILHLLAPSGYQPDGFRSKEDPATGVITVEFTGSAASSTAVDEMTLLHAADLARQRGQTGFMLVDRRDYTRTMTTTINGMPTSSASAGYKTEMDIRLVDLDNLPAELEPERMRILDANRVYENLAPIYIQANEARRS